MELLGKNEAQYRGVRIAKEALQEYVPDKNGKSKFYTYTKINGVKYYYNESDNKWFSILNGEIHETNEKFKKQNDSAIKYYIEAASFRDRIKNKYKIEDLKTSEAVYEDGEKIKDGKTLAQKLNWRRL